MPRLYNIARYTLVALLISGAAWARVEKEKEIVRIQSAKNWKLKDSVCFHREKEILACGKVVGTASYVVAISVDSLNEKVRRGDRIYVSAMGPGREPSSYGDSYVVTRTVPLFLHGISAGFASTGKLYVPEIQVQAALGRGFLLGIMPLYTETEELKLLGTFVTLEAYFSGNSFDGFFAQTGLGFYSISAKASGSQVSWVPSAQLSLGWRFVTRFGFNLGLSAGGQYTSPSAVTSAVTTTLRDIQPLVRLDIGLAF